MIATTASISLLFIPGLFVIPLAIGGVGLATQATTKITTWALMRHMKKELNSKIEVIKAEMIEYFHRLEKNEAALQSTLNAKTNKAEAFRFATKVLLSKTGGAASIAASIVAPMLANTSRLAPAARTAADAAANFAPFAQAIGTPLMGISLIIDAYDTFALIRDFKKPSEMSDHLEKKVLKEFKILRFYLIEELGTKFGGTLSNLS